MEYTIDTGITSFKVTYMKSDIPTIGDTVNDGGKSYIITDVNQRTKVIEVVEITA